MWHIKTIYIAFPQPTVIWKMFPRDFHKNRNSNLSSISCSWIIFINRMQPYIGTQGWRRPSEFIFQMLSMMNETQLIRTIYAFHGGPVPFEGIYLALTLTGLQFGKEVLTSIISSLDCQLTSRIYLNMNKHTHCTSFPHIDMVRVIEILPHGWPRPVYPT